MHKLKMKILSALVLALPFVLAAPASIPAAGPHKDTTTTPGSLDDQKKQSIKPNAGQYASPYGYYDYTAYPYAQPYAYPAASYDYYSAYPQQVDPYYQPDYGYYQQQAAEQAAYEQALKEWKYKKYLYDTNQTHLRPDLFPEHENLKQQLEKQEENKPRARPNTNQDYQPARYTDYQQRTERPEAAHDKQEAEFPLAYKVTPVSDRKYQPEKQQVDREQTPPPKKSAAAAAQQYNRFDDFPERQNTNNVRVKQDELESPAYFSPEQAYTPREKAHHYPSAPQSIKEPERELPVPYNHYPQPQSQQPQPVRRPEPQQHATPPPLPREREREPIVKAYPPAGPPNQYTQGPPHPQHLHQERYRNVNNNTPEQPHAIQSPSSSPPHRGNQSTSQSPAGSSRERPERDQRDRYQEAAEENPANYDFFNRESIGKKILGKHGYLDNAGAEWVVTISPTSRAVNEGSEVTKDSAEEVLAEMLAQGGDKQ